MDTQSLTLAFLGIYALILIIIGALSARNQDHEGFVIGNRSVGLIPTVASIGAGFRDVAFVSLWITLSFLSGYGLLTILIGSLIGYTVISFIGPRLQKKARERNFITSGQMIEEGLGPRSRTATSSIILFISLFFSAAQFYVIGTILSKTMGFPPTLTIGAVALVIGFYLWVGGYASVIRTDYVQFFVILAFASLPFFIPVSSEVVFNASTFGSLGWVETSAGILIMFLSSFVQPDMWQRIFSAKNPRILRIGLPLGGLALFALSFGLAVLGLYAKQIMPDANPETLFYTFFEQAALPPIVLASTLLVLFAMAMSTIDTQMYLFTSTVLEDFKHIDTKKEKNKYVFYSRILMVSALTLMAGFALMFEDIITALMGLIGVYNIALPAFILAAYGFLKPSKWLDTAITSSCTVAFLVFIYMFTCDHFAGGFLYTLIPVGISVTLSLLSCLYYVRFVETKKRKLA